MLAEILWTFGTIFVLLVAFIALTIWSDRNQAAEVIRRLR